MDSNTQAAKPVATDAQAVHAMRLHGGSFVKQLAQLWLVADPMNQARVKESFRDKFDEYRQVAHYDQMAEEASRMGRN